jgi:hypothetical protein
MESGANKSGGLRKRYQKLIAGAAGGGALVVSTKMATKLPVTVNPVYDLNGKLVSDGLKGYEYDDANQLVRVTVTNQ